MQNKSGFSLIEIMVAVGLTAGIAYFFMFQMGSVSSQKNEAKAFEQEMSETKSLFHLLTAFWSKRIEDVDQGVGNIVLKGQCDSNTWCTTVSFFYKRRGENAQEEFIIENDCHLVKSLPLQFRKLSIDASKMNQPHFCATGAVPYLKISVSSAPGKTKKFPVISPSVGYSPFAAFIEFKKHDNSGLYIRYQSWTRTGTKTYHLKSRQINLETSSWAGSGIIINPI